MACISLLQLHAGLCCHRHALHIPMVISITPPLPGLREQVSPNQLLLSPSCLDGEQMPEGGPHTEAGPKPKLNPTGCATREEEGKSLRAAPGAVN